MPDLPDNARYRQFLEDLKGRVRTAQLRASLAVNRELILLYWSVGRDILARQEAEGWGAKVVDQMSRDLRREFPEVKGFSTRNLKYMRAFAEAWPDEDFVQQAVAQIPWGHNVRILEKVADPEQRRFYIEQTRANGWSRSVLVLQIESRLHERHGQAVTNFDAVLPAPQSDLAQQITKDPYCFDFLTLHADAQERELEAGLIEHIRDFLLELGVGFSFVGSQIHLEVGDQDFYLDMLFYHLRLRCFVVVELKVGAFTIELAHIDATVGALVRRRQPPDHLRDKLRFELEIEGHKVRILEVRPMWNDPSRHTRTGVAQFTYTRTRDIWTLYWMRRDSKWHPWGSPPETGTLTELVHVVDEDRYGGFWG